MRRLASLLLVALWLALTAPLALAQGRSRFPATLPANLADPHGLSIVLGRPTDTSIVVSVFSATERRVSVLYGPDVPLDKLHGTPERLLRAGEVAEFTLEHLAPDAAHTFKLACSGKDGTFTTTPQHFHTQRAPGSPFVFEIQGDSHPERPQMFDPRLYAQTLLAASADRPDFYMTIGDDFSVDTLAKVDADAVRRIYLNQRSFLSLVGQSAPIFLVNGNHEQAADANLDGTANSIGALTQNARNAFFPQPAPDGAFYSGDATPVPNIGLLRDYYAWTWGDALFVVIDPYWHSSVPVDNVRGSRERGTRDLWNVTLGDEQYKWLAQTLRQSSAKFKFVFAHHVLGTGRGGIERAGEYEWGGKNRRGDDDFARRRPGWEMPIHQLFVKHGVTIFFQGHDHVFAHQQLDGVVYQTLPLPADPFYETYNRDAYRSGDVLGGSGRVRVSVSPAAVKVEYVCSVLPEHVTKERVDGSIAVSYEIKSKGGASSRP